MIYFYLTWMEYFSTYVTCGAFEQHHLFSLVVPSFSALSIPERVVGEYRFSLDVLCSGIGVVPGSDQSFLGLVLGWLYQFCPAVLERSPFLESAEYGWSVQLVLSA